MINTDVLIVGAGPVGLFLANELNRHSVSYIIADIGKEKSDLSRATGIHSQTLELFEYIEILDEFIKEGVLTDEMRISTELRSYYFTTRNINTKYPFGISIEQEKTEEILKGNLGISNNFLNHHKILGIREKSEFCTAYALDLESNSYTEIQAKFIVGCDGVHSTVRKESEINFIGETYNQNMLAADLILKGNNLDNKRLETYLNDNGLLMIFGLPQKDKYRVFADVDIDFVCDIDSLQSLITQRGRNELIDEIIWADTFFMNKKIANKFSTKRVYLAGDACHSHSPAGGHGMNIGIMDAFNLAWKIKLVLNKIVAIDFLDSYETERRPIANKVLFNSDIQTSISFWDGELLGGIKEFLLTILSNYDFFKDEILKFSMELNMNYMDSPLNCEFIDINLYGMFELINENNEIPNILEINKFINGPKLGHRYPDLSVSNLADKYLHSALLNSNHILVFFDGNNYTLSGYKKFLELITICNEVFNKFIDILLITTNQDEITCIDKKYVLLDTDNSLHLKFAAFSECLYLIRPDGFISYRALPVSVDHFKKYLESYKLGNRMANYVSI